MSHSTPLAKVYSIQPHLDVPEPARIRFPMWLRCVYNYNIVQMELTTLDILGAFYLVALDADWELRPENILPNNRGFRPRPLFAAPTMYGAQAAAATIPSHTFRTHAFELQQRTKADLHAAILAGIGQITLESINSKHRFSVGSLSPLDLVKELKATFGTITRHEIAATEAAIAAPLSQFNQFRDFCSSIIRNYEFRSSRPLVTSYWDSLELTCSLLPSIVDLNSKPTSVFGRPPLPSTNALSNHSTPIFSRNTEICPLNRNLAVAIRFNSTMVKTREKAKENTREKREKDAAKAPSAPSKTTPVFPPPFPPHRLVLRSTQKTILTTGTVASTPIQLRPSGTRGKLFLGLSPCATSEGERRHPVFFTSHDRNFTSHPTTPLSPTLPAPHQRVPSPIFPTPTPAQHGLPATTIPPITHITPFDPAAPPATRAPSSVTHWQQRLAEVERELHEATTLHHANASRTPNPHSNALPSLPPNPNVTPASTSTHGPT
jgi:hypothetical protein